MEVKQRESTLEVLKRLQTKNKKPVPSMYDKQPIKVKIEDIINIPETTEKVKIKLTGKNSESLFILNQIKSIEKQMKSGKNYLDSYYDLQRKEKELLKLYDSYDGKNDLPEEVIKKVKELKKKFNK